MPQIHLYMNRKREKKGHFICDIKFKIKINLSVGEKKLIGIFPPDDCLLCGYIYLPEIHHKSNYQTSLHTFVHQMESTQHQFRMSFCIWLEDAIQLDLYSLK